MENDLLAPWLAQVPEWFREESVVESRYALAHAVMQWRYRNFRIIMYRPFVIRMALATSRNGRMINDAPAAEVHAYNQCLADAEVTIKSISKYWTTNEHNRLAAWYALYVTSFPPRYLPTRSTSKPSLLNRRCLGQILPLPGGPDTLHLPPEHALVSGGAKLG